MFAALDQKLAHYRDLEQQLYDPAVASNPARSNAIAKERGALAKLIEPYLELLKLDEAIREAEALAAGTDADMRSMADEELAALRPKRAALHAKIEDQFLVDPSEDFSKLIVEIRAGTGGDEAALFAGNLYEMYSRYARTKGWTVEEIGHSPGEAGGFKEITFGVTGDDVYQFLRYESGGHRVQRVPATETQGRIHTSLATVAVLPEPDDVQVSINMNDIEWETMRAGGAGGQHVNKTESAVRIWYKKNTPDQIEVKCQDGRSQHKNREQAMRVLRTRIFERQQEKLHRERSEMRKNQIGGGDRNERIRTYNYPQNRCTDHRIEFTAYHLDAIMAGGLDEMIQPMRDHVKRERLAAAAG
ncbi:peptide chain release factor 1 : Peptide chain release factor 1 OS=Singulisphaera acidiphila (strain ATCC BAA-1392 / DSM 18658 / VKM B-2454 / MOB10) GN=prfA PE=3 SV=1: PCRF: RF-1 [Gemmataceae bacterium]|nr:peptide chain release factor 1 : Peptide chain release factor 1 OS=Singulisphaera acidiphila (strain ATCC BAA-1392 / DSM 18658 / VKM B-2454 / MOB10) GN=prfA PE=3 SV=1: PCRF: RF-1 [Gemmataceae bacterium]VTT99743.1 peptide chain release factor 1 : Peptide chain release factor 1 OS=Singulisphaera acidiphila (strain ATCC BAA-1392 / DSM 18658 / VKM B-2454 / MOB10) GN=prfA PE=3 SV=1: PCRF: RF-1 [Gemmataceae bacterium]